MIPLRLQYKMAGTKRIIEGVLSDFSTPIITKIGREPKRESLIELHQLISGNAASVASNLGGGRHGQLVLTTTDEEYMSQKRYAFVPPRNPGNYPPTMGTTQVQAIETERFRKNQELFRRYTAVEEALKIRSSRQCNQYLCPHWWTS